MAQAPLSPAELPALYGRIRFEPALEEAGLRLLAELDVDGCRAAFGALLDRLELGRSKEDDQAAVLLLHDLLQKVAWRLHRSSSEASAYHAARVELLVSFAEPGDAEAARRAFIGRLNAILVPLGRERGTPTSLVERARTIIEESYQRRLSLSTVAARLHVSPNYLSRLFRQQTGVTLTEYVHRTRLEHARLLLGAGDRSIAEVGYIVGYQNYRDFYRNFIKYENMSPRQVQRGRHGVVARSFPAAVAPGDA